MRHSRACRDERFPCTRGRCGPKRGNGPARTASEGRRASPPNRRCQQTVGQIDGGGTRRHGKRRPSRGTAHAGAPER
eukprot:8678074-Lingulodinium_polyedra.AAC.1